MKQTKSCHSNGLVFTINRKEKSPFRKTNKPQHDIYYSSIRTRDFELMFNLKGEIWMIKGLGMNWPHPYNWLARTDGNDWVYYSAGRIGNKRISDFMGENYLPCLSYQTNQIFPDSPYTLPMVAQAFAEWAMVYGNLHVSDFSSLDKDFTDFIDLVLNNGEDTLHKKSLELHGACGGNISVLPPDSRHVNYEVIPLMISEGCIYKCSFCCVKSKNRFRTFSFDEINGNIEKLKAFYGENIVNYRGLYLGDHDGLLSGFETINFAATKAFEEFGFNKLAEKPKMFLFGSFKSFMTADGFFEELDKLPYKTYINLGFESFDQGTLDILGKPVKESENILLFKKMNEVNRSFENIEVTGNLILGNELGLEHNDKIVEILSDADSSGWKGGIYFSPLVNNFDRMASLEKFFEIKKAVNGYPVYIYLIQRL